MQVNKYYYISIKNISMRNVNINKRKKDVIDWEKKLSTRINKNALFLQHINDSYKSIRKLQKYRVTRDILYEKKFKWEQTHICTFQYH